MPTIVAEPNPVLGYIKLSISWADTAATKARILRYPASYDPLTFVPPQVRSNQPIVTGDGYGLYTLLSHSKAVFYDFEAPLDAPVTYTTDSAEVFNTTASTTATLPSVAGQGWLIDPFRPGLNLPLKLTGSMNGVNCPLPKPGVYFAGLGDREFAADSQAFGVSGARRPVVAYSVRKDHTSELRLATRTLADRDATDALLANGGPVLLQLTAEYGEADKYMQVGDVATGRLGPDARKPYRGYRLPYAVIDAPEGESQGAVGTRYRDLCAKYATWDAMKADGVTWEFIDQRGTDPAQLTIRDVSQGARIYARADTLPP